MATQVIMPKLTYEMLEGLILEWLCKEGDAVSVGQALYLVETDKATIEVPADEAGILFKILVPAGNAVPVSTPVAWIGAIGEETPQLETEGTRSPVSDALAKDKPSVDLDAGIEYPRDHEDPLQSEGPRVRVTPIAKRLAQEFGIDLGEIWEYTGHKMIRETDIQAFKESRKFPEDIDVETQVVHEEFDLIQPTPLQRTMASRMTQSATIPQMPSTREVDLSQLEGFRNELQETSEQSLGFRLTYTHLFATLVVRALEGHPTLNASWTDNGIALYKVINLGVAMATKRGLVVPVVRNAHQLSLEQIANQIVRLQTAADSNRLSAQDLSGGTFTMTNVGMLGVELSIPLLNPPQSAILGVGAKRISLMLEADKVISKPVASVTVTVDHRFVDGAAAADFLTTLKEMIESPSPFLS